MKFKMLIASVLVVGTVVKSSWQNGHAAGNSTGHSFIQCCQAVMYDHEKIRHQVESTTQGWTDGQYEYEVGNIRDQSRMLFDHLDHLSSMLAVLRQHPDNLALKYEFGQSIRSTRPFFHLIAQRLEQAQQSRNARLR